MTLFMCCNFAVIFNSVTDSVSMVRYCVTGLFSDFEYPLVYDNILERFAYSIISKCTVYALCRLTKKSSLTQLFYSAILVVQNVIVLLFFDRICFLINFENM